MNYRHQFIARQRITALTNHETRTRLFLPGCGIGNQPTTNISTATCTDTSTCGSTPRTYHQKQVVMTSTTPGRFVSELLTKNDSKTQAYRQLKNLKNARASRQSLELSVLHPYRSVSSQLECGDRHIHSCSDQAHRAQAAVLKAHHYNLPCL